MLAITHTCRKSECPRAAETVHGATFLISPCILSALAKFQFRELRIREAEAGRKWLTAKAGEVLQLRYVTESPPSPPLPHVGNSIEKMSIFSHTLTDGCIEKNVSTWA